jgi:predicted MFS family arabinose efflux permease
MPVTSTADRSEWSRNWTLVAAAALGFSFSSLLQYSLGLFIAPLRAEFGWSSTQVTGGMFIVAIGSVFLSPIVGALIDRWGSRLLGILGLVALIAATCAFSLANGSTTQWLGLWTFFAIADLTAKSTVWTTAVAAAFDRHRSLAIGVTMCGASVAHTAAPILVQNLISGIGWRSAFVALGLGWGGVALVVVLLFFRDARPIGAARTGHVDHASRDAAAGLSVRAALRNPALIRIGIATFITLLLAMAIAVHQVPMLTEAGLSAKNAAYVASAAGFSVLIGNLATGRMMDRLKPSIVGGVTLAASAIAFALLFDGVRTITLASLAMIVVGYTSGAKLQICAYLTTRYAGMRNYGKIFGIMSSLIALGGGLGPLVGSILHDTFGNYNILIGAAVVGTMISALLIFGLGPYPDFSADQDKLTPEVEAERLLGPTTGLTPGQA